MEQQEKYQKIFHRVKKGLELDIKDDVHNTICSLLGADRKTLRKIDYRIDQSSNTPTTLIRLSGLDFDDISLCIEERIDEPYLIFTPTLKIPACYTEFKEIEPPEGIHTYSTADYTLAPFVVAVYYTDGLFTKEPGDLFRKLLDFRKTFIDWTKTVRTVKPRTMYIIPF